MARRGVTSEVLVPVARQKDRASRERGVYITRSGSRGVTSEVLVPVARQKFSLASLASKCLRYPQSSQGPRARSVTLLS